MQSGTFICFECGGQQFRYAGDLFNGDKLRTVCEICGHQEQGLTLRQFGILIPLQDECMVCTQLGTRYTPDVVLCDDHAHVLERAFL